MSTQANPPSKPEYLMLIRGTAWQQELSAEEIQNYLARFTAWVQGLQSEGKVTQGFPLERQGKLFTGRNVMTDGPFVESKEAIAGLIIIRADSFAAAVELVSQAPCLEYGQTVELRPIASEPPELRTAREMAAARGGVRSEKKTPSRAPSFSLFLFGSRLDR